MMTSQASKCHDPMYNFDTHFPERLSRLHLHSDSPGSFRKRKSRAQRCGSRYKTQPVTFDEITEVDEEPSAANEDKPQGQKLKGQLQAFSRSMDGLLPKTGGSGHDQHHHFTHSHSRSGSRKYHRHPDCIPERVEAESATSPQPQTSNLQEQVFPLHPHSRGSGGTVVASTEGATAGASTVSVAAAAAATATGAVAPASALTAGATTTTTAEKPPVSPSSSSSYPGSPSHQATGQTAGISQPQSPPQSPPAVDGELGLAPSNMAPRRQKVTAKAKKRQKASEEGQGQVS